MDVRPHAEKAAEARWIRCGEELPDVKDDVALLALVERAQRGDEDASAGLLLVMAGYIKEAAVPHGWAIESEAFGLAGRGAGLSMWWLAVAAYDTAKHTTNVARRIGLDVGYLARKPTRRADARYEYFRPTEAADLELLCPTDGGCDEFEASQWLEESLEARNVSPERRRVAHAIFVKGLTKRETAEELDVPVGSISRHTQAVRNVLATEEHRRELVA